MRTTFLAHASSDHGLAIELAEFLESGCDINCYVEDGVIRKGQDLIAKAEEGFCADVLVMLLTPASSPPRWVRERWEPLLFNRAKQENLEVLTVLLRPCAFPDLLRRRNFFDATSSWPTARRLVKRWFWTTQRDPEAVPGLEYSAELEDLYLALSDRAGTLVVSGDEGWQFAREAQEEFESVFWVPCQGRTLAQAAGELGDQLALTLDGTVKDNCRRIRDLLAARRCLVVLDAPGTEITQELVAGGRTSIAITRQAVKRIETPETPAYARNLIAAQRYAEAYELLYRLLDAVIDPDGCARELTWICEHWDRVEEANALRLAHGPPGASQLSFF